MTPKVIRSIASIALPGQHAHHNHAFNSRRDLILKSAGAFGLLLGSQMLPGCGGEGRSGGQTANEAAAPDSALRHDGEAGTPVPVPADPGFDGIHIYGVDLGSEPSSVGDFDGFVGAAVVDGTGVGRSSGGKREDLLFDTDMRFMQGTFRGTDGQLHRGTFGFV